MRGPVWWALAMLCLAWSSGTSQAADSIGAVKAVTGTVEVQRGKARQPVIAGMALFTGDVLITGDAPSGVSVIFMDDTRFALGAHTVLSLRGFVYEPEEAKAHLAVALKRGKIVVQGGESSRDRRSLVIEMPHSRATIVNSTVAVEVE